MAAETGVGKKRLDIAAEIDGRRRRRGAGDKQQTKREISGRKHN
jgi:hypothetical protein